MRSPENTDVLRFLTELVLEKYPCSYFYHFHIILIIYYYYLLCLTFCCNSIEQSKNKVILNKAKTEEVWDQDSVGISLSLAELSPVG